MADSLPPMKAALADLAAAAARGPISVYGLTRAYAAYAMASILGESGHQRLVVVTPDSAAARRFAEDLDFFLDLPSDAPALQIPEIDTSPYAELSPDRPALMRRLAALYQLSSPQQSHPRAICVSAQALLRKVIAPAELLALSRELAFADEIDRDQLAADLVRAGYVRAPVVEDPGTFAVRGGVVDVYPATYDYPVRIDLYGDEIESMRTFDPQTQRTLRDIERLQLCPARDTVQTRGSNLRARLLEAADAATHPSKKTRAILESIEEGELFVGIETLTPAFHAEMVPLWDYLPTGDDALWLIIDPDGIARAVNDELDLADDRYRDRIEDHRLAFPPDDHYVSADTLALLLTQPHHRVEARTLEMADAGRSLRLTVDHNLALRSELERMRKQQADELIAPLTRAIAQWREDDWRIALVCSSQSRADKLAGLLALNQVEARVSDDAQDALAELEPGAPPTIIRGSLSSGFSLPGDRLVLLTDDDIFGEHVDRSHARRAARRAKDALLGGVSDFSQLELGDYLVHDLHGVGKYLGLAKLPVAGTAIDFLHLEYQGGVLYMPVYRLGEVQRYVGAQGISPRLDKLGGQSWDKRKRKVSLHVRALAEDLLQLYAQRAALPGHAFPPADLMFREFEATFGFEETPDQQKAIDDVMADMESDKPMDRLVCGDVGYGKTEIALRAAFKAVLGGYQVAILAPTTVLVEQHYRTMKQRFGGWPLTLARLSRFAPRKEQLETLKQLAAGTADIVVGTHRVLSRDVRFKKLGLIIVDEEQRFGVTHKERLKKIRTQIDVLTLTATPIPRTLHLAMAGLRDLSIIATPPADRRSIRTFVAREDAGVLREAIRRELGRNGQCFFVSPRINETDGGRHRSLYDWAEYLRELVPDARVSVAHGQMSENELEKVMVDFVAGGADILCSTTIIESGLDIPRANTMFIARADRFGLAQMYQLRGRIGRSRERAYCYLLVPPPEKLSDEARRRLETLQKFTDLGAGFHIASHDLEIRGAGDLLGRKQSGSIAAIGFEAYTAMLEDAVAELRGEPIGRARDPELNVDLPGFIPDDYVPDTGQRLDLYKRLASADDEEEILELVAEIADRYGPVPAEVTILGDLSQLRVHARKVGALALDLTRGRMTLTLSDATPLAVDKLAALVSEPGAVWRLSPDQRLHCRLDPDLDGAGAARARLLELASYAT